MLETDLDHLDSLINTYLPIVQPNVKGAGGSLHLQLGTEEWLKRLFPQVYRAPIAPFHRDFWDWTTATLKAKKEERPFPDGNAFFAIWSRGFAKCLASGTFIWMADGTIKPIELVGEGDRVLSYDGNSGQSLSDKVIAKWESGPKECFRLRTRTGKELTLTADHRLWTFNGWRSLRDITLDDRIALPRKINPDITKQYSDGEARLLAYMLAEGGTTSVRQPSGTISIACQSRFTNADQVIVDDFKSIAESMGFCVKPVGHHYGYGLSKAQGWLREQGLSGKASHEKQVPAWVFCAPEKQRLQFLAAMLDTDGYITESGPGITLSSRQLIDDLQRLFLSVGVISSIYWRPNNKRGAWSLQLDREGLIALQGQLPLKLKGEKFRKWLEKARYSLLDTYPSEVFKNLPKGKNREIRRLGVNVSAVNRSILRKKVRRAIALFAYERWRWLESADVFWDKIVEIVPVGIKNTYDIETEKHHNFIADGIVSHNSTNAEILPILEAAWLGTGLCLYVSGTQELANKHLASIEELLLSDNVRAEYPMLGQPMRGVTGQTKNWKQEFLQTSAGYSIIAVGLDVGVRGLRVGTQRPSLIVFDDVDDIKDTPAITLNKLQKLTLSVIPTQGKQTIFISAQNLIHRHGIINQIYENKVSALSNRYISGPHKAIEGLVTERQGIRDIIVAGKANWDYLGIPECQDFIDNSGLNAFLSEYQHDLKAASQGLILPEYDEDVHVITWSQFKSVYGMPFIPSDWAVEVGHDWGSTGIDKHPGVVSFIATASERSILPGITFLFGSLVFDEGILVDSAAEQIVQFLAPDSASGRAHDMRRQVECWRMSHEAKSERDTYRAKFGLPFMACDSRKTAGIAQLRHFLRIDPDAKHPFKPDTKGASLMYWVVDDDQLQQPRDDRGLWRHRQEIVGWRWKPVELKDYGMPVDQPVKWMDDALDSLRHVSQVWMPRAIPLTIEERRELAIPANYRKENIAKEPYGFKHDALNVMRGFKLKERQREEDSVGDNWTHSICSPNDDFWNSNSEG